MTDDPDIERVGVVGVGLMGAGIAEVSARAGLDVLVHDVSEQVLKRGVIRIERSLAQAVERDKLTAEESDAALARIETTTELEAFADRQVVVEAVVEDEQAKLAVFRTLDEVVQDPDAVLASNTSSIPIMRLAMAIARPEAVIGLHFFNPVPVMQLVELVPSLATSGATADRAEEFAGSILGKKVVHAPDRAGFIVNALLIPYLLDAVRMFEAGLASPEDIDAGMRYGAAHPMGPLALCDLIGNDTMIAVAETLYGELREERYAPPPGLRRMVEAGRLGRKSGRGFYRYEA